MITPKLVSINDKIEYRAFNCAWACSSQDIRKKNNNNNRSKYEKDIVTAYKASLK